MIRLVDELQRILMLDHSQSMIFFLFSFMLLDILNHVLLLMILSVLLKFMGIHDGNCYIATGTLSFT